MRAEAPAIHDLKVVDLGFGMAAALVAKQFAELGAQVSRIEPEGGDPFYDLYPAYRLWRQDETQASIGDVEALLESADLCIIGGEDFPGLESRWDPQDLARRYPRLIILDLVGYPEGREANRPSVDLLVQARTGIVYEQFSGRPIAAAFPMPSQGAALQGAIGAWVALIERQDSGLGQIVTASLAGGTCTFWGPFWMKAEKADEGFIGITPRDVRHLILECADKQYIQLTLGVPGALARIYEILGIPEVVDPKDRGIPNASRGPAKFFGDIELMNSYAANRSQAELLAAFRQASVPAEAVLAPGESWDDEQTRTNGIIRTNEQGWSSVGNPLRLKAAGKTTGSRSERKKRAAGDPPLAGIKILDCGIFVAGPYASKLLADYGAEVVRVEPPTGRPTLSGERTIICANHGKRSICLDAKADEGRRILAEMCKDADIVHHNFRPGVADRLGMDQQVLRGINPNLITLETTAYGPIGPKAGAPGFDMVIQAHCGLQKRAGGVANPPLCSRTPLIDFAAGAFGAIALLASLYERRANGTVLAADTNLLNVGLHMLSELIRSPDGELTGAPLNNAAQTGFHPAEALYPASDGWVAIAARSEMMAVALARLLELEDLGERRNWGEAERQRIEARTRQFTTRELLEKLGAAGVWAEECVVDAWTHVRPDGKMMRTMNDAVYGEVVHCIGPLAEFSRSKTVPASRLSINAGENSREVLVELGFAEDKIEALFKARIVV